MDFGQRVRPVLWIALAAAIGCSGCGSSAEPSRPDDPNDPNPPPGVSGASYALDRWDGNPAPFLVSHITRPNGTRAMHWIVGDTIRFGGDGRLAWIRWNRWSDQQEPGAPPDIFEDAEYSGGYFEQDGPQVRVAWNWISVPPIEAYSDTLRLREEGLVRMRSFAAPCPACPPPADAELVYVRVDSTR